MLGGLILICLSRLVFLFKVSEVKTTSGLQHDQAERLPVAVGDGESVVVVWRDDLFTAIERGNVFFDAVKRRRTCILDEVARRVLFHDLPLHLLRAAQTACVEQPTTAAISASFFPALNISKTV